MAWPGSTPSGFGQPASFGGFGAPGAPAAAAAAPQAGFAAFGQPAAAQQPASPFGGFGQQPQQQAAPFGGGFGQQAASFGAQPAGAPPAQPAAQQQGGFAAFGAPPAASTFGAFGQQASQPAGFGQQASQPAGFGQQAPQPAGFGAPSSTFQFGQQQQQQQPVQPHQFTFGQQQPSAQQPPAQQAAPTTGIVFGSAQRAKPAPAAAQEEQGDGEEMDAAAIAAAKAAALASLPKFGGRAAASGLPPPPPPPKGLRRAGGSAAGGLDAEEVARRAQRASRFGAPPSAGQEAPQPAPAPVPAPAWAGRAAQEGDMTDGEGEDEGGDVRAGAIVGTCEEMCPAVERERRSRLSDIQIFERVDPQNSAVTSPELAVKRFARTIDDSNNAPEFFRTRGALSRTMAHLRALLDRSDVRLGLVHKFLWDRYRSVRQDLYIQGMDDEFAVGMFEEIVRFHLLSEHELCAEEASITEMEGFNSHLNMEQMNKALISLGDMYNKLTARGRPAQNEAEFRAYHLLSLMGQHGKFKGDQQAFLSMLQAMRPEVRGSAPIQWVLKLQRAFASNNFVRFFALVRQAPYLLACLSHIFFGQVRGRALRTLGDTLAPKADTPTALELSWLVDALMLDSLAEAHQLCTMHGYATAVQGGVPVVLLLKGAYVDPPPPVPRKPSALISSMAPAERSLVITTAGVPPMSAEEAAAMERQRQEQLQRLREQEARRAQEAAEQQRQWQMAEAQRQQEAAAAAAQAEVERQRHATEASRLAEEARRQEAEAARQRKAALQEQQRQQAALEEQRRQEQEAQRQQQLAELRRQQEEQQRAAMEAERRRREEAERERLRREAAEAAERQRLAELERQRQEELRRLEARARFSFVAAAKRARQEAKRRWAMQRFYLARWRLETRRRIEERKRLERLAANLKACRVGMAGKGAAAMGDGAGEFVALSEGGEPAGGLQDAPAPAAGLPAAASRAAIDLPTLAAPLLLQRSPAARSLFWKVLLAPPPVLHASSLLWGPDQQALQHLQCWLSLQLQCGRPVGAASGSAYVDGPLQLRISGGGGAAGGAAAETMAELVTCVACPATSTLHCGEAALAGASGIILALPGGRASQHEVQRRLPLPSSMAARLPTLLVAATEAAKQHWEKEIGANRLALTGPVLVLSVQEGESAAGGRSSGGSPPAAAAPAAYSRQRLVQGLRWLAAHSPPQPPLKVVTAEEVARNALAAASAPLRRLPAVHAGGLPAAQLLCGALQQALGLVEQSAERSLSSATAAWQWPPPEIAPPALRTWHDGGALRALRSAWQGLCLDPQRLLGMAEGGSQQALTIALHMQLAALEAAALPPLVLPPDVERWLEEQLEAVRSAPPPPVPRLPPAMEQQQQQQWRQSPQQQLQQQQHDRPNLGQKRKFQAGGARQGAPQWQAAAAAQVAAPQPAPARSPPISSLPLWEQLRARLDAEKAQAAGLRDHALLAAAGEPALTPPRPVLL